ncbi:hypothetical protein Nepgr_009738 [Nepenthes gracilis]|uniref:PUM-HD domain-containing protein n=1 Tax=Nepenthes gracilis TaxID=150966 RepID=A0AAD3SB35_NEPGR|nr:hypothetical protein Nepgr_009738 [Nepenthes gracilis]
MSYQKFASNVVEKCLTFGSPKERQVLVNEMPGSTEENEPLQTMIIDPFGDYVVQKVIEPCDNQTCELILSRVNFHLNSSKYTYGKHIIARVEKLLIAGACCSQYQQGSDGASSYRSGSWLGGSGAIQQEGLGFGSGRGMGSCSS